MDRLEDFNALLRLQRNRQRFLAHWEKGCQGSVLTAAALMLCKELNDPLRIIVSPPTLQHAALLSIGLSSIMAGVHSVGEHRQRRDRQTEMALVEHLQPQAFSDLTYRYAGPAYPTLPDAHPNQGLE